MFPVIKVEIMILFVTKTFKPVDVVETDTDGGVDGSTSIVIILTAGYGRVSISSSRNFKISKRFWILIIASFSY